MWLAVVMYCVSLDVTSCDVIANVKELHITEESCREDAYSVATSIVAQGFYASPGCFKIGEGA